MLTSLISVAPHPVPGAQRGEGALGSRRGVGVGGEGGMLGEELNSWDYLAYLAHPPRPLNQIYSPLKWSTACQRRPKISAVERLTKLIVTLLSCTKHIPD